MSAQEVCRHCKLSKVSATSTTTNWSIAKVSNYTSKAVTLTTTTTLLVFEYLSKVLVPESMFTWLCDTVVPGVR